MARVNVKLQIYLAHWTSFVKKSPPFMLSTATAIYRKVVAYSGSYNLGKKAKAIFDTIIALVFGLFIAGSHLLFRALVMRNTDGDGSEAEETKSLPRWLITGILQTFPRDFWHQVAFVSLLVSIFSAFVLYYHFPSKYNDLKLTPRAIAILHFVIPTLQILSIAFASLMLDRGTEKHAFGTIAYLWLFIWWDWLIIRRPGREEETQPAAEFRRKAREYLLRVDFPAAAALTGLVIVAICADADERGFEAFLAGIVASQAGAALVAVVVVLWDEHLHVLRSVRPVKKPKNPYTTTA